MTDPLPNAYSLRLSWQEVAELVAQGLKRSGHLPDAELQTEIRLCANGAAFHVVAELQGSPAGEARQ